jgi:hypothetical protein
MRTLASSGVPSQATAFNVSLRSPQPGAGAEGWLGGYTKLPGASAPEASHPGRESPRVDHVPVCHRPIAAQQAHRLGPSQNLEMISFHVHYSCAPDISK